MFYLTDQHALNARLCQISELFAGIDDEFNAVTEELDREFAELRLQLHCQ